MALISPVMMKVSPKSNDATVVSRVLGNVFVTSLAKFLNVYLDKYILTG